MFFFYSFMAAWFFRNSVIDYRENSLFVCGLNTTAFIAFALSAAVEYIKI
jgi:hypothetical protein